MDHTLLRGNNQSELTEDDCCMRTVATARRHPACLEKLAAFFTYATMGQLG